MRVAIYTSNRGNRMRKAIERGDSGFGNDIKLFFSEDPDTEYLKPFLDSKDIVYVLDHFEDRCKNKKEERERFSNKFLELLRTYDIDYVFCNGKHILSGDILKEYRYKIVNFHGALLPGWGGVRMLDKMLKHGEFLLGTTAMFIDEGVDTGPIIMETVIPSEAFYSVENGYDIVLDTQVNMMHIIHKLLQEERIKVVDNKVVIQGADYQAFSIFPKV